MVCRDTMQARILEVAKKRFKHYGYAKTSVAEIASDLQMSPGNLYRYFPGKIDIALAIADEGREAQHNELARIAAAPKSAVERLRKLFHADLTMTYATIEQDPRTFELAQIIQKERSTWLDGWLARERELIVRILNDGNAAGEFDLADPAFTAEMLQAAMMKFRYPQLWSDLKLPALEREFEGVACLLLVGLAGAKGSARTRPMAPLAKSAALV